MTEKKILVYHNLEKGYFAHGDEYLVFPNRAAATHMLLELLSVEDFANCELHEVTVDENGKIVE